MPEPLGKDFTTKMLVDTNNNGYKKIIRSRTGFLIYMNNELTYFLSEKQTAVETI